MDRILRSGWVAILMMVASGVFGQSDIDSDLLSLDSILNIKISTASKYDQTISEAPASVTIVTKEEIARLGYNDLSELLNQVRDFYLSYDREFHYLGVRGFSRPTDYNNRISVMVNGTQLSENVFGSAPLGSDFWGFNLSAVERVEVLRGPSSALYGSSPMLCIINIITMSGHALEKVQVSAEAGSFGKYQGSVAAGTEYQGLDIAFSGRIGSVDGQDLYFAEYDDSSSNFGVAHHRDWSKFAGANLSLSYKGLQFQSLYTYRAAGIPTSPFGANFNDPLARNSDRYQVNQLKYTRSLKPNLILTTRLHSLLFRYEGRFPYSAADGGLFQNISRTGVLGAEARVQWDIADNSRLVAGTEVVHHFNAYYSASDRNGNIAEANSPFSTYSFFAQSEYQPFRALCLTAGGRFDHLYLGRKALTPRLAINYYPFKSTTLKLLYGEAFRSPNIYEYNYQDDVTAKSNSNLVAERIKTTELVVMQTIGNRIYISASGFRNKMLNLIDQVYDTTDGRTQHQNVGLANGLGSSVEANYRSSKGNMVQISYAVQKVKSESTGELLTNSPMQIVKAMAYARILKHFGISGTAGYQTGRKTVQGNMTSPFLLIDLQLSFEPEFGQATTLNRFRIFLKCRNLLGTAYGYPAGLDHLQDLIPQDGRTINLKLQMDLF